MQTVELKDLIDSVPVDQKEKTKQLFEDVFDSLMWTHVTHGKVEDVSPLTQWKHRDAAAVESDLAYLQINRSLLRSSLSEYLTNPNLASKEADWLFLNVLTYAEYVATVSEVRKKVMGIERYVASLYPPRTQHTTDIFSLMTRPWHLPVMFIFIALGWAMHPFVGVAIFAYLMFSRYRKKQAANQVNATLANMLSTYLSFNTADLGWAMVISTLQRSGKAGVIWDASLYALAERRKMHGPNRDPN